MNDLFANDGHLYSGQTLFTDGNFDLESADGTNGNYILYHERYGDGYITTSDTGPYKVFPDVYDSELVE